MVDFPHIMKFRCWWLLFIAATSAFATEAVRDTQSKLFGGDYNQSLRFGFHAGGTKLWGAVPYSPDDSSGWGFAFGMEGRAAISPYWHVTLITSFERMNLSRTLTTAGAIAEPSSVNISQTYDYLGVTALVGFRLLAGIGNPAPPEAVEWWLDGGLQWLFPLTATQTTDLAGRQNIIARDRPLLIVLGPSATYVTDSNLGLLAALRGFYNLGAQSNSRFYGARLELSLTLGI
jgi:hypothetical protein